MAFDLSSLIWIFFAIMVLQPSILTRTPSHSHKPLVS